jgi:hypothetical protein
MFLVLNRQQHDRAGMSDTGLTVAGMTEPRRCYDVTVTIDRDVRQPPTPVFPWLLLSGSSGTFAPSVTSRRFLHDKIAAVTCLLSRGLE